MWFPLPTTEPSEFESFTVCALAEAALETVGSDPVPLVEIVWNAV